MTKPLVVIVPHRLGKEGAKSRLQNSLDQLRGKLSLVGAASVEESWAGDEMRFRVAALGQVASGRIEAAETSVTVEVELPATLAWLGGLVADRVRREGVLLLERK